MAKINLLLQGLSENDDHDTAVNELLKIPNISNYLLSLAFVRSGGVKSIRENLSIVSESAEIFLGIRNGITSIQSIIELLKLGIQPYAVDTAANNKIFHPKIYAAYNNEEAHVILGSANLTYGGLNRNIEASSRVILNRKKKGDEDYLIKLISVMTSLPTEYPEHVFKITSARQAVILLKEGRLEDERLTRLPSTIAGKNRRDSLNPMSTYLKTTPIPHKGAKKRKSKTTQNTAILVWESKALTERSLNIQTGNTTNITGDANLGLGSMVGIDFQHYFRDIIFPSLNWSVDENSRSPHLERANADIELIIKNNSYGLFSLEVTHDPRTDTRSYKQRNVMTKIKWGEARPLVAKRDLLDRTLRLFKKTPTDFVIVID